MSRRQARSGAAILCMACAAACAASGATPTPGTAPPAAPAAVVGAAHPAEPVDARARASHDPSDPADLSEVPAGIVVRLRIHGDPTVAPRIVVDGRASVMPLQLRVGDTLVFRTVLPAATTRYAFETHLGPSSRTLGPFDVPTERFRAVPWVGGSVGYQVFPERFANGDRDNDSLALATDEWTFLSPRLRGARPTLAHWDDAPGESHCCHQYFGGDLQGIRDHLAHLDSLGVTLLYLNPVFSAGSAHGYDTWDHLAVEPSLGTEALLRTLVQEARAHGMRVLWDFVPNHVGVGHAAFRDALARGRVSPYASWFTWSVDPREAEPGNAAHYATFAGIGAMPKLATAEPAVRAHLMDAVRKWTALGFAGIRVDVPWEVTDAPAFFRELRRTAKGLDPDQYLVGEYWTQGAEWLRGDRFDALMNYAVGRDLLAAVAAGTIGADSAARALSRVLAAYPDAATAMQFNVIATHDTPRLLTMLGGGDLGATASPDSRARQRLASAMLFALPGVPVTFQGDECAFLGTGGGGSGERNRYPMQWGRCDPAMVAHYAALARLRRAEPALTSAAIADVRADGTVLRWSRGETDQPGILAIFNTGAAPAAHRLPFGTWLDLTTGLPATGTVTLESHGWRWFRRATR
ncbi:MAG: glycoside hydrolase family 13 protein [Gemmatimonadaceae bacterium]|nr:glycoside hydrolase family 13 protein [Gemmatimonadaceae bacterium]